MWEMIERMVSGQAMDLYCPAGSVFGAIFVAYMSTHEE